MTIIDRLPATLVLEILYTIKGDIFNSLEHDTAIRVTGFFDRWIKALEESHCNVD